MAYVELIRNTPFIVQLFFIFFGLPAAGVMLSETTAAFLAMTINLGAYSTEIIRAGIQAVPKGHIEAGVSLAMTKWEVLRHMTAHVDTGESLPRELFDKMVAARNFQSGLQTLRQIEFSLFDMLVHADHDPKNDFMPLLDAVRDEVTLIRPPAYNRTAHTFSHIFAGGYAAGYYSYKWAEVLSADAYAAFEEAALQETDGNKSQATRETGRKYRQTILEVGGSRPAMESFKAFRGREPTIDALLRHQGMA